MGLDILIYSNNKKCFGRSEISENFHYWLFNQANLDTGLFRVLFKLEDYYLTDVLLSRNEIKTLIKELKEIEDKSPFSKEIKSIINTLSTEEISEIRINGD